MFLLLLSKMASSFEFMTQSWLSMAICAVATFVLLILALLAYTVSYQLPSEFYYDERPWLAFLYLKALCAAFKKMQGVGLFEGGGTVKESDFRLVARDCR